MISPQVSEINGTFKGHSPFGDDQGRGLIANQGKIMRLIGFQMTDDNVVLAAGHPHRTCAVNPLRQRPRKISTPTGEDENRQDISTERGPMRVTVASRIG